MKISAPNSSPAVVPSHNPSPAKLFWKGWERKGPGSMSSLPRLLDPRHRSLIRASVLVLLSFFTAAWLSDFPHNRANPLLLLPALAAFAGTADTIRCMRKRWSFYHGGVMLLIYMDLMADIMILFFLIYPYALWITASR